MSNNEYKSHHLLMIIIISVIISTTVAVFFVSMRIGILPAFNSVSFDLSAIDLPFDLSAVDLPFDLSAIDLPFDLPPFTKEKQIPVNKLLDIGKPSEALDVISNQPDSIQKSDISFFTQGKAWYLIAWQRYESENWSSYAKNPNDWFEGNDVDNALFCLHRSAQSQETWAQATNMIGVIYMEKGWYERAKNTFQSILIKDVNQRDAYLNYGIVLSRQGKNENAVKHLERWNDCFNDPDFIKNLFFLYLFDLKNYEKAAVLGDLYLKIAPRGDIGILKVKRELIDLLSRFPEYFDDTMTVIKDRPPEFKPRRR